MIGRSVAKQLPGLWGGMVGRKRYADDMVTDALEAGIGQFVILGAGFDTRSFRLIAPAGAKAFEVDLPDNIARKQRLLEKRFGQVPRHVTLMATDFETDDLTERLAASGFEPDASSMYVVEAITQYLTQDAAQRLFSFLATAPAASRLIFTYIDQNFLDGRDLDGWESVHRKWSRRTRCGPSASTLRLSASSCAGTTGPNANRSARGTTARGTSKLPDGT
nr:SAM-dependent methyltransferase [Actinopolymorpha pittospori]